MKETNIEKYKHKANLQSIKDYQNNPSEYLKAQNENVTRVTLIERDILKPYLTAKGSRLLKRSQEASLYEIEKHYKFKKPEKQLIEEWNNLKMYPEYVSEFMKNNEITIVLENEGKKHAKTTNIDEISCVLG